MNPTMRLQNPGCLAQGLNSCLTCAVFELAPAICADKACAKESQAVSERFKGLQRPESLEALESVPRS